MRISVEVTIRRLVHVTAIAACCLVVSAAAAGTPPAKSARPTFSDESLEFFEKEIRPLLVKRCFECHSGEAEEVQAGLRLDSREAVLTGGDTGTAVVPGKPKQSLLIDAINYGELYQMPPKSKLPAAEIAALTKWVEIGAPWPAEKSALRSSGGSIKTFDLAERKAEHWAWQPVQMPRPPDVQDTSWPTSDIDRFILAKLEANDLAPAGATDKRTLIRRAYFDIVGLPPPWDAVERFVADDSPKAFDRVVDELLASPRFGERWARHWLDLVRYAETYGHEFDYPIQHAWQYRDYVIRALNADVPYDQFAIEHIAGDLLDPPRLHPTERFNESIIGTGFWWFGEQVHAPVDVLDHEADRVDNQIDVLGKTFLGLTLGCARCHDHKFDAISTADVYALWGFAKSTRLQTANLDPHGRIAAAAKAIDAVQREVAAAANALFGDDSLANAESLPAAARDVQAADSTRHPGHSADKPFADFNGDSLSGWLVVGEAFGDRPTRGGDWTVRDGVAKPLPAGVAHSGRFSTKLTGALRSKNFTIEKPRIAYRLAGKNAQVRLIIHGYRMDQFSELLFKGCLTNVDHDELRWQVQGNDLKNHLGKRAYIEILDEGDGWVAMDEIRFVDAGWKPPSGADSLGSTGKKASGATRKRPALVSGEVARDARVPLTNLTTGTSASPDGLTAQSEQLAEAVASIAAIEKRIPEPMRVLTAVDGDGFDDRIHIRGNTKTLGDLVPRQFLAAIAGENQTPISASGSGRLELARRIVSRDNPLFARVMVNRIWHHLFGRGIVTSVDNFGVLGERPSHPELLDHLARRFIDDGYSVKRLIRAVMLSRAYQMASRTGAKVDEADPNNLLFHRQNLKRLEGEAIRDAILAVSGRIDLTMYGSPVKTHLTPFMFGRGRPNRSGPLDGAGRRSIYLEVRRNFLSPMMLVFDTPLPFSTVGRRNVSNVPAQALILMNDPFVAEQARRWAEHTKPTGEEAVDKVIDQLFQQAFARTPKELERRAALGLLTHQAAELSESLPEPSLAAWTDLCHALFNAKEFVFVE